MYKEKSTVFMGNIYIEQKKCKNRQFVKNARKFRPGENRITRIIRNHKLMKSGFDLSRLTTPHSIEFCIKPNINQSRFTVNLSISDLDGIV